MDGSGVARCLASYWFGDCHISGLIASVWLLLCLFWLVVFVDCFDWLSTLVCVLRLVDTTC